MFGILQKKITELDVFILFVVVGQALANIQQRNREPNIGGILCPAVKLVE